MWQLPVGQAPVPEDNARSSHMVIVMTGDLDEDYRLVAGLQANLDAGVRKHLVFGRNEPGLQHRHATWAQAVAGPHR